MEEMRCPCGGIFQSLGMEYLRTGAVSDGFLFGRDANAWAEGAIPVELFSCGRCRALRFCAEEEWVARRQEEEREKAERARRHEERLEQQREERVQIAMKDYASYSEKRLRKIADGETWSNHCEEEREAARRPRLCLRALRKAAGLPPPPEIVEKVAKPLFRERCSLPRAGFDRLRRTTLTFAA